MCNTCYDGAYPDCPCCGGGRDFDEEPETVEPINQIMFDGSRYTKQPEMQTDDPCEGCAFNYHRSPCGIISEMYDCVTNAGIWVKE